MDPRTLGLNPSFNALFEDDLSGEGRRPRDGNGSGTAEFDIGALEAGVTARPTITNLDPTSGVHGQTINLLTATGERLGGATALTFLTDGTPDAAITATNLSVNPEGTQLTATVTISGLAALGSRLVMGDVMGDVGSKTTSSLRGKPEQSSHAATAATGSGQDPARGIRVVRWRGSSG
jgi:hypothetical protein